MVESRGAYYHAAYAGDGPEKRKVWTPLGRDYGAALRKWAEIEGAAGVTLRLMQHVLGRYLKEEATKRRAETQRGYAQSARNLMPIFGKMLPEDVDPRHIREFLDRKGNVSANRDIAMLSDVFRWANEMGLLPRDHRGYNPCKGVRRNAESARSRYVTHAEYWRLLRHAKEPQMRLMIAIAYHTGLRQADVLGLRWADVTKEAIAVRAGKTGKRTLIEVTPALERILARVRALKRPIGTIFLFATRKGQQYSGTGFRSMWRRVKADAKLLDVQFKDLRRKAGSDVSEQHAHKLLQHSSLAVTKKHYRALPEKVRPVR